MSFIILSSLALFLYNNCIKNYDVILIKRKPFAFNKKY